MRVTLRWTLRLIVLAGLFVGLRESPVAALAGCYYCMTCGGGNFACCINTSTVPESTCDGDGPGYADCVSDVDGCYMDAPCLCADG
jgi:hypothetical protein